jgi:choloylglycine hydrolase
VIEPETSDTVNPRTSRSILARLALPSNIAAVNGSRIIAFLIAPFFVAPHLYACTIFCAANGDTVLVGNNEDGSASFPSKMWFVPAGKFGYGRVCFGWYSQAQGGMNDRGLFFDWAALPGQEIPLPQKLSGKLPPDGCVCERVLATCATVDDVVRFCEAIEYVGNPAHFLAVDKSGNSVVGEWIKGNFKPIRAKNKQLITNFFLTDPKVGNYPCPRFETVTRMLAENGEISVDRFTAILRAVAASFDGGGTKYSNIYDLGQGQVTVYGERQFDHGITIDLAEELRRGFREVDLKDLAVAAPLAGAELRKALDTPQPKGKYKVPSVKELLSRFDEVRGGRRASRSIRSCRMTGTMSEDGATKANSKSSPRRIAGLSRFRSRNWAPFATATTARLDGRRNQWSAQPAPRARCSPTPNATLPFSTGNTMQNNTRPWSPSVRRHSRVRIASR